MDPREPIQVSFQLPAGALDALARLTEQLRLLTAAAGRQESVRTRQTMEQGENRFFDPEQFRALRQEGEMAAVKEPPTAGQTVERTPEMETAAARITDGTPETETAAARVSDGTPDAESVTTQVSDGTPEAEAVRPELGNDVYTPQDAGRKAEQEVEDPAQAGPPVGNTPADGETAAPDMGDGPSSETIRIEAERVMEEIPAVQAENHPAPDPAAVRMEPESQILEAETVWEQVTAPDDAPSSVQAGVPADIAAPVNAGFALAAGPDMPQSRWAGGPETSAVSGGAPLTAEDVSLAFQRDERRYDNGFPLY